MYVRKTQLSKLCWLVPMILNHSVWLFPSGHRSIQGKKKKCFFLKEFFKTASLLEVASFRFSVRTYWYVVFHHFSYLLDEELQVVTYMWVNSCAMNIDFDFEKLLKISQKPMIFFDWNHFHSNFSWICNTLVDFQRRQPFHSQMLLQGHY